jgi:Chaperone of endosialidase
MSVDSGRADASGPLTWRTTCGDPVCRVHDGGEIDSGIASCATDQQAGNPCTMAGATCDPHGNCGQKMMCADHKLDVMCPISNRSKKQDIRYLSREDLERLADEVSKVRLTTYTYRDPSLGTDEHLGFIIEDNPQSPAVYPNQQHVDLYGYASMAVAALQVQKEQLRTQERQMTDLRRELSILRDQIHATQGASCRP